MRYAGVDNCEEGPKQNDPRIQGVGCKIRPPLLTPKRSFTSISARCLYMTSLQFSPSRSERLGHIGVPRTNTALAFQTNIVPWGMQGRERRKRQMKCSTGLRWGGGVLLNTHDKLQSSGFLRRLAESCSGRCKTKKKNSPRWYIMAWCIAMWFKSLHHWAETLHFICHSCDYSASDVWWCCYVRHLTFGC